MQTFVDAKLVRWIWGLEQFLTAGSQGIGGDCTADGPYEATKFCSLISEMNLVIDLSCQQRPKPRILSSFSRLCLPVLAYTTFPVIQL